MLKFYIRSLRICIKSFYQTNWFQKISTVIAISDNIKHLKSTQYFYPMSVKFQKCLCWRILILFHYQHPFVLNSFQELSLQFWQIDTVLTFLFFLFYLCLQYSLFKFVFILLYIELFIIQIYDSCLGLSPSSHKVVYHSPFCM